MTSNLACIGLYASDAAQLSDLVGRALAQSCVLATVDGVTVRRWQDPSGARLIVSSRNGKVIDLLPSFAAEPGVRLRDVRRLNDHAVTAIALGEQDQRLTALTFELEQRRQGAPGGACRSGGCDDPARSLDPDSAVVAAALIAFGVDVTVHDDAEAFARDDASLLDPRADRNEEPPARVVELDLEWPIRLAPDSFLPLGALSAPATADSYARLAGTVLKAEQRNVDLTGECFISARVRTLDFTIDVCLDSRGVDGVPRPGQVISGTVYLVASIESFGA
jgi:hypothetical protein